MKVKVNVTAKDIREGKPGSACFCPIARAAKRAFNDAYLSVCCATMTVKNESFALPPEAQAFIAGFDNKFTVKPFSFHVEV